MSCIRRSAVVAASPADVWSVLAEFGAIAEWADNVDHSCLLTSQRADVGASRRVQVGRATLVETITAWQPEVTLSYSIDGLPPVIRAVTTSWRLTPAVHATTVTVTTEIDAGNRPPQRLIARLVGRRFANAADEMLAGLTARLAWASSKVDS